METPDVNRTLSQVLNSSTNTSQVENTTETLGLLSELLYDVLVIIARAAIPLIGIFGIITNTINLLVFWSMGLKDTVTSSFFALSLADWFYLFVYRIAATFSLLSEFPFERKIDLDNVGYILVWYSLTFLAMSAFLTTYIAVQRCCCVALPFKFKGVFTNKRNAVVISIICITSVALYVPILSKMGLKGHIDVQTNTSIIALWFADDWKSVLVFKDFLVGLWMPIGTQVINVVCMFVLISGLRKSSRFRKSAGTASQENNLDRKTTKSSKREIQIVKAVAVVTFMFIISNTVPICQALARRAENEFAMYKRFTRIFFIVVMTKHAFQHLNASLNFFVYLKFNTTYKDVFKKILKRAPKKSQT